MNWDAIEAISAAVATVATLGTLIYLAIQIRESNKLARTESLQNVLNGYIEQISNPLLADPELNEVVMRGFLSWEALTPLERGRFVDHQTRQVLHLQNVMQLYDRGLLDEIDFEAWVSHSASVLITPGGKAAWEYNRNSITPTVVSLLEEYIREHPDLAPFTETHPYRFSPK
jgi:hypothetical protein